MVVRSQLQRGGGHKLSRLCINIITMIVVYVIIRIASFLKFNPIQCHRAHYYYIHSSLYYVIVNHKNTVGSYLVQSQWCEKWAKRNATDTRFLL